MFRNLNAAGLGIAVRQSEMLELALTHKFQGINFDVGEFLKRIESRGLEDARRLIASARLKIGEFQLPFDWHADDENFKGALEEFSLQAEHLAGIGALRCVASVLPTSNQLPYHENFELHRQRLGEIARALKPHGIQLGIAFSAAPEHRDSSQYQFIHEANAAVMLLKTISGSNVGLVVDTWDWMVGGGTVESLLELGTDQIVSVRLADIQQGADLAVLSEKERCLPTSEGLVDCLGLLTKLAQENYDGPVSLCVGRDAFEGLARDSIVKHAAEILNQLWEEAEVRDRRRNAATALQS